ncbi:MAG TPA: FHA domain-containing protein [Verrucomicrobiae bacterium]|nr:FHA domain-containing protein [Verrucomicrobiae bacterium]
MPYLIQKKADGTMVQQWQLGDQALVFGRGKDVDVKIDDPEMSKRHFQIEYKDGRYLIRDLNSVNGTWVDKRLITEAELTPGNRIRAGQTHFVFEKGLGTVIGEMAKEHKGYETVMREITKDIDKAH